jgi:hypothetical protein
MVISDCVQIVIDAYQLRHVEAENLGHLCLLQAPIDITLASVESWLIERLDCRAIFLALTVGYAYHAVDAKTKPFTEPQVVPSGVSDGVCERNVTHRLPI